MAIESSDRPRAANARRNSILPKSTGPATGAAALDSTAVDAASTTAQRRSRGFGVIATPTEYPIDQQGPLQAMDTHARQSQYRAAFRCIAGCPGEHPLDEPLYRCPRCGDLLEVVHDREPLS